MLYCLIINQQCPASETSEPTLPGLATHSHRNAFEEEVIAQENTR